MAHLLENGCGLGSFFPNMVVQYALLTQREELIKREQGRMHEWTFSPLLVEKYKELCYDDSGYRAYHARPGMVAAVSGKVRKFLEDQTVSKDEYTLKPVRILGREDPYYLLFLRQIPHTEIVFSKSLYKGNGETYRKFSSYSEYTEKTDSAIIKFPVLPKKYEKRDLICIQNCAENYMSARLIKAFHEAGAKGIEFSRTGHLKFI